MRDCFLMQAAPLGSSLKVCGGFALDEEVYPSEAFDAPAESLQIGQKI
jgi:hypothetical protein